MQRDVARISALVLPAQDPEALAQFYCDVLGMIRQPMPGEVALGYGGGGAALILRQSQRAQPYHHEKSDRYWKIALTLPDLDHAYRALVAQGVAVSDPHQFRDIAYMAHLVDPEGHVIELIQHSFAGNPLTARGDAAQPLCGGAQIGLITLRSGDIEADMKHCQQDLGMSYLSRQSVSDFGFDLYFFGPGGETPPVDDVNAIENREWLWQRPYTVLEFQHLLNAEVTQRLENPIEVLMVTQSGAQVTFS